MSRLSGISSKTAAIVLGAALVVIVAIVAVTTDLGTESVPDGAVAVVDGEEISVEDFETALAQSAAAQQLDAPPAPEDPQYEAIRDEALNSVLDTAWIQGEASERGVEVSDREVQQEFESTKAENFKTEQEYQQFLEMSGFTQEDVDLRVKLQLLSTKIQEQITEDAATVPDADAEEFYEANKEQFVQPGSRDVRIVLAPDQQDADEALQALQADNSPENWNKVAKELSTDAESKDAGGVREGVTEGTFDPAFEAELFEAPQGEVLGPVQTQEGFYVFQVDQITEERTVPLDEAREQIDQQLSGQIQQDVFANFLGDYRDRWTERTVCGDDFLFERCDNGDPPAPQDPCDPPEDPSISEEQRQEQIAQARETSGCPPPVISNSPVSPGSFDPFTPPQSAPQRPHPPGGDDAPAAVPPGALPPGAVPGGAPGAAPQGAPPQGAPPQGAPPQGAQAPPPGG